MPSICYKQVYERFFTKVQAYDLAFYNMANDLAQQVMCSYLHASIYYPMIRKLFNTVALDDTEETITYEMVYTVDEDSDAQFLLDLLGAEMAVKWVAPKVSNLTTISQFFGTSESKYFSQAAHLEQLMALKESLENHVRSLIADRGAENNTYLDGTSTTATMRNSQ